MKIWNTSKKRIKTIIYSLIGIFILLLVYFIIPLEDLLNQNLFIMVAILGLLFLILGIILIILARKEKGKLKVFLILTGISATFPLIFSILHNFFYALAIVFENLSFIFEPLHAISFIIALLIAPILFTISSVGSIILLKKFKSK